MRRRRRFGRKKNRLLLIPLAAAVIFASWRADNALRPIAETQAEHHAAAFAGEVISSCVSDYIDENRFTYGDFAAVLYDGSGSVASVEAVPLNINRAQSELTASINRRLSSSKGSSTKIALGSLTSSYMLAGKGPSVKLRICPTGNATVKLTSSFSSAGINQTCHRISAIVTADISSSIPLYSFDTSVSFEFLLAESIIIGDVPEVSRYAWSAI